MLWLTVLLTVIGERLRVFSMRGEALAARNTISLAQARAAADGAVERMAFELSRPRNIADVWQPDGVAHVWQDGDARLAVTAVRRIGAVSMSTPRPNRC